MVTDINRNDDQPPAGATQQAPDRRHRVLVVDDHPVVTDSIAGLLEPVADLEVFATARDVAGALQHLRAGEVDVVLLDLQLDGESGLDLLARLDQRPCVPVLVFSVHPPGQRAVAALCWASRSLALEGASSAMVSVTAECEGPCGGSGRGRGLRCPRSGAC